MSVVNKVVIQLIDGESWSHGRGCSVHTKDGVLIVEESGKPTIHYPLTSVMRWGVEMVELT